MTIEDLKKYKEKLSKLSDEEKKLRDIYLSKLAKGEIQGPKLNYPSVSKNHYQFYDEEAINHDIPNVSMLELIKEKNKNNLSYTAIEYYGKKYTYGEMFDEIDKIACKYKKLGVKKGDVVAICMPSTPEAIFSLYALNKIGAVCDMLDPRSNPNQLTYYLNEDKAKYVMLCKNYYPILKDSLKDIEKVILTPINVSGSFGFKAVVGLKTKKDNMNTKKDKNVITYKDFYNIKTEKETVDEYNRAPEDIAVIIHSSGTTSVPKGIVLTNKNINSISIQYSLTPLDLKEQYKFLSVIPIFASFGVSTSVQLIFFLSMENRVLSLVSPESFSKRLEKDKINFTLTVPGNFKYLTKEGKKRNLSNLKGPGAGGYSLTSSEEDEINNYLKENGCDVPMLMGWGASECSATLCLEFPECRENLSSGVPLPLTIISTFKFGTDEELEYGQEGELCATGPSIMLKYLNNPEKTKSALKVHDDGKIWYHTGDIGYVDEKGRIFPCGRNDRMIINEKDGFKIRPQIIEDVICSSKYIDSCLVVKYNHSKLGTVPKAFIVPKENCTIDEALDDVKRLCKEKLSVRQIPVEFEVIDKMPYTPMGKPDHKKLELKM